jgi:DNA-binding NtrC family response regulator
MAQTHRPTALVVEDDQMQRVMLAILLEESDMDVISCESGEAAASVLEEVGGDLCLMFTDVNLAGAMTGADLAVIAKKRFPGLDVIVTSGKNPPALPVGVTFMPKPWHALNVIRAAEKSRH